MCAVVGRLRSRSGVSPGSSPFLSPRQFEGVADDTSATRRRPLGHLITHRRHPHPGARAAESLALRRSRVDLKKRIIRIGGSRVLGQDSRAKTGKSVRDVLMHEPVFETLRACWPTHPAAEDFVFTTPTGAPLDAANFYRREWVPMLRRLGIRARPFYNTRYTYITYMLELTGNPLFVARQTGTSLEMIEKHYGAVRVLVDEIDERIAERHQNGNLPGTFPLTSPETQTPQTEKALAGQGLSGRAGDRARTGDVQLGKLAFYH